MARDMVPEAEVADKASEAETRAKWIAELRRQGHRQCHGKFIDGTGVCALGLLGEVAGIHPRRLYHTEGSCIGVLAGLRLWQCQEVVARNDGKAIFGSRLKHHKHTFAEIADVVEGWFK